MADLRDRLKRIQELKKSEVKNETPRAKKQEQGDISILQDKGWQSCGYKTLKRDVYAVSPVKSKAVLPKAMAIVVPDLAGRELPSLEDFLFFDLETTGLSGGAGTLAFLAAFGRFVTGGKLRITQYLLLDYPGESDFLDAVLKEFKNEKTVITTYNGKCFDSQILKTRCLMNGIKPPEYNHADLLHPARRLWKNIIYDCSQGSIETKILGLDRSSDTPGALAPEIWFDFLRTGRTERLDGICDHNCADITGLATILAAMISIAKDPITAAGLRYDTERLALYWRGFIRRHERADLQITADALLRHTAEKNYPRAAFVYALDALRGGNFEEGRKRLLDIAKSKLTENIRAAALRSLAIDSERRLKNFGEALDFAKRGMELKDAGISLRNEFERQKKRLVKKLHQEF